MSVELFGLFVCTRLGVRQEHAPFEKGSPAIIAELLWPFSKSISEHHEAIKAMAYDPAGEDEFDRMLEKLAWDPTWRFTNDTNAGVKVWHERFTQAQIVLLANEAEGRQVFLPPRQLSETDQVIAAALLWFHRMDLPFHPGTTIQKS